MIIKNERKVKQVKLSTNSKRLRIMIIGSRFRPSVDVTTILDRYDGQATQIITGGSTGADAAARAWAYAHNVDCKVYEPEWSRYGIDAITHRNTTMINDGAEVMIAFPMHQSTGTLDCVQKANTAGIPTTVIPSSEPYQRNTQNDSVNVMLEDDTLLAMTSKHLCAKYTQGITMISTASILTYENQPVNALNITDTTRRLKALTVKPHVTAQAMINMVLRCHGIALEVLHPNDKVNGITGVNIPALKNIIKTVFSTNTYACLEEQAADLACRIINANVLTYGGIETAILAATTIMDAYGRPVACSQEAFMNAAAAGIKNDKNDVQQFLCSYPNVTVATPIMGTEAQLESALAS